MSQFTKLSLAVEHNGKPYFVSIPQDRWPLLLHMVQGLSDSGKLNLVPAPDNYRFEVLERDKLKEGNKND